jgi:hypothetical protein
MPENFRELQKIGQVKTRIKNWIINDDYQQDV